jgi:hypothetical protein
MFPHVGHSPSTDRTERHHVSRSEIAEASDDSGDDGRSLAREAFGCLLMLPLGTLIVVGSTLAFEAGRAGTKTPGVGPFVFRWLVLPAAALALTVIAAYGLPSLTRRGHFRDHNGQSD